ncbi:MAG: C69 family dipeptidase [Prevotella sp.]|nr:C69 family dipeptidase [Candidatus Equicola faecalis]
MKRLLIFAGIFTFATGTFACTNFIVGKKASTDGSVIVSYNADSYGMYGNLYHHAGGTHKDGEMRQIYEWDTNKYLGEIPQAPVTYNVIGQMNANQVSITETTFGGREELADSTGLIDYGSLIYIALERSKTAREAIDIMTRLAEKYGYYSEGETFSICDKNEAWLLEMMGKGAGGKGAVWVAVRIPDDCISGHANQSRITKFLKLFPKADVLYSKDCIKFAREKGYFKGKDDKEFSFRDAYAPSDFSANRYCEARVWSFFKKYSNDMEQYLDYIKGEKKECLSEEMPLYIKPNTLVSTQDIKNAMRDHYEGTALDITNDLGAGAWEMPYRPSPLSKKVMIDGKETEVFNERPTSTQQTGFGYVGQMRSWLPDAVGGIVWWTNDDPNMVPYTPIYCGVTKVPACYQRKEGVQDEMTFSWKSAFWLQNTVSNMVYPYYSKMFPDVKKVRDELEAQYNEDIKTITSNDIEVLNNHSLKAAQTMMKEWNKLFKYLVVKHNDMVVKKEENGKFKKGKYGFAAAPTRPGYSTEYWQKITKETGTKYIINN